MYRGKDVFVWLPTGFGKLICYHALLFVFDSKLGHKLDRHKWQALIVNNITSWYSHASIELRVNNKHQRWNNVTMKMSLSPTPTYTHAQIGDDYMHAWTAETRPSLLLHLFGPGNEAIHWTMFSEQFSTIANQMWPVVIYKCRDDQSKWKPWTAKTNILFSHNIQPVILLLVCAIDKCTGH